MNEPMRIGKDLVGKRYGALVIEKYKGRTKSTYKPESVYKARCDCGEIVYDTTRMIRMHRHCGCKTTRTGKPGRPLKIQEGNKSENAD